MHVKPSVQSQPSRPRRGTRAVLALAGLFALAILDSSAALADDSALLETELYPAGARYGLDIRNGDVAGTSGTLVGAQWLAGYSNGLALGVAGHSLASSVAAPKAKGRGELSLWYAGFYAEYEVFSWSFLNVEAGALLGGGRNGWRKPLPSTSAEAEWREGGFRLIEPGLIATLNLSSRSRLGFGLWYRQILGTSGPSKATLAKGDLGGPLLGVTLRTGIF